MVADSLVSWKKVKDLYGASDRSQDIKDVEFIDELKSSEFIDRDETNAKAMRLLKVKW